MDASIRRGISLPTAPVSKALIANQAMMAGSEPGRGNAGAKRRADRQRSELQLDRRIATKRAQLALVPRFTGATNTNNGIVKGPFSLKPIMAITISTRGARQAAEALGRDNVIVILIRGDIRFVFRGPITRGNTKLRRIGRGLCV